MSKRTGYKAAALVCIFLILSWPGWAGYDTVDRILSAALLIGSILYLLYEYAKMNLAKARKHNDELK
jgi:hypothetical protein